MKDDGTLQASSGKRVLRLRRVKCNVRAVRIVDLAELLVLAEI